MPPRRKEERKSGFGFEEAEAKPPSRLRHPVQRPIQSAHDQLHRQLAKANEDDNVAASAQRSRAMGSGLLPCRWASTPIMRTSCARSERPKRRNKGWTTPTFGISRPGNAPKIRGRPAIPCPAGSKSEAIRKEYAGLKAAGGAGQTAAGKAARRTRQCHGKAG